MPSAPGALPTSAYPLAAALLLAGSFDNTRLFWHYTVVQGLLALALVRGFPRLIG